MNDAYAASQARLKELLNKSDMKSEERTKAVQSTVDDIISRVLQNIRGCENPNCYPELEHYTYKKPDVNPDGSLRYHPDFKDKPNPAQYVGMTATKLMELEIAEMIFKLAQELRDIDEQ